MEKRCAEVHLVAKHTRDEEMEEINYLGNNIFIVTVSA